MMELEDRLTGDRSGVPESSALSTTSAETVRKEATDKPVIATRAARHDVEELPLATRLRGLVRLILVIAAIGTLSALAIWEAAHLLNLEIQQYLKP